MSDSVLVCWRDGIPVTGCRGGYRHALGGKTGAIPPSKRHKPVPMLREEFSRAFSVGTPREEALAIAERMRALDKSING